MLGPRHGLRMRARWSIAVVPLALAIVYLTRSPEPPRAPSIKKTPQKQPEIAPRPVSADRCDLAIEVVDRSGRRVEGAEVAVVGEAAHQARTDRSGSVLIRDLAPALHEVSIEHPTFGNSTTFVLLCPTELVRHKVSLGQGAAVRGRVLDQRRPIEDAEVRFVSSSSVVREARSDDRGEYRLFGLEKGTWTITARARGFRRSAPKVVDLTADHRFDIQLEPALNIAGHVVDGGDIPLSNWTISAVRAEDEEREAAAAARDTTNMIGAFFIEDVEPGDHVLLASGTLRDGPEILSLSVPVKAGDENVLIKAPLAATITGVVIFEGADPPPFYKVRAAGSRIEKAISDRTFRLRVLRAGSIDVTAEALGWEPATVKTEVRQGESAAVEVRLKPRRELRGEVVDHKTQRGIPNAKVTLITKNLRSRMFWRVNLVPRSEREVQTVVTDEEGRFVVDWVDPVGARFEVEHYDYPPRSARVVDAWNKIDLEPGYVVSGLVVAQNMGEPNALIRFVHAWKPTIAIPEMRSDRAGGYRVVLPEMGEWWANVTLFSRPEFRGRELTFHFALKLDVPFEGLPKQNLRIGMQRKVVFEIPPLNDEMFIAIAHENGGAIAVDASGTLPAGPGRLLVIDQLPEATYKITVRCTDPWIVKEQMVVRLPLGFVRRIDHL